MDPHHGEAGSGSSSSRISGMDSDLDRSQDSGSLWGAGGSVNQWSQIRITLMHQSDKSDPDPHQSQKRALNTHQCDADPLHWLKN